MPGTHYTLGETDVSSPLEVFGEAPELRFTETDQTDPAGRYRLIVSADIWTLQRAATASWATATDLIAVDENAGATIITLSGNAMELRFTDTGEAAPDGRFRIRNDGDSLFFEQSLTGTFTTSQALMTFNGQVGGGASSVEFNPQTRVLFTVARVDLAADLVFRPSTSTGAYNFQGMAAASAATTVFIIDSLTDPEGTNFPYAQFTGRPVFFDTVDMVFQGTAGRALRWVDATGTNTAGGALTIRAQLATGNAATGSVIIQTGLAGASGTAVQSAYAQVTFTPDSITYQVAAAGALFILQRANGTIAAPTAVLSGDYLVEIVAAAYGTSFARGGELVWTATETWSGTVRGTKLDINTITAGTTTMVTRMSFENANIQFQGGARLLSLSATEIGIQVNNSALTVGSEGSLVAPVAAVAATDALAGDLSGALMVRTDVASFYCRVGTTWRSVAVAGFSFPKHSDEVIVLGKPGDYDETICPLCQRQMQPHETFALVGDRFYDDTYGRSLHSYGAHLLCSIREVLKSLSLEERRELVAA